ncbi:ATP-binding protein [Thalassiella azotivora]
MSERQAASATTLPAEPASASRARRFVAAVLTDLGCPGLVDAAELAVSELVTNALVHSRSGVEVSVRPLGAGARICVRDDNPAPPVPKAYEALASTGRGLQLVADLAHAVGVEPHGEDGKTLWFELRPDSDDPDDPDDQGCPRSRAAWTVPQQPEEPGVPVVLRDLPVRLWAAAQQHADTMLRELLLHRMEALAAEPLRPHDDLAEADTALTLLVTAVDDAVAAEPGADVVDVHLVADVRTLPGIAVLQDVLDQAERLAEDGDLLALPGLPEVVALRDWCCGQVVAQVQGVPAKAWEGVGCGEELAVDVTTEWDATAVSESPAAVVAADERNRLVAVSAGAARLLGWAVEDLVGRRVVALVPDRLREAHVAGFTQHLVNGRRRILGRTVELPALHASGRELPCRMRIEVDRTRSGRPVFVATFEPLT